jgi:hypothetical protein
MKTYCRLEVFELLAEAVGEPRKPAHLHNCFDARELFALIRPSAKAAIAPRAAG